MRRRQTTLRGTASLILAIGAAVCSHLANLSLAHKECNAAASHLSVREKVKMAVRNRCAPAGAARPNPAS